MPVTRDDVLAAATRIRGRVHRTPTFSSRTLGEEVWLKAELFQKTGSFKPRGVLNKLATLSAEEQRARRDRDLGRKPCAGARLGGARGGDRLPRRHVAGRERGEDRGDPRLRRGGRPRGRRRRPRRSRGSTSPIAETGRTLVHPFDDPLVLAGQGTVALELLEDAPAVETIVVPVGGGGLVAGIAAAAPDRRVRRGRAGALDGDARRPRGRPARPRHPGLDRGRALGAVRRRARRSRCCRRTGTSRACSSPRRRSSRRSGSSTSVRSSPASRPRQWALRPCLQAKLASGAVGVVVSGGNVDAQTATAILARR